MTVLTKIERDGFAIVAGVLDERSRFELDGAGRGGCMRMTSKKLLRATRQARAREQSC